MTEYEIKARIWVTADNEVEAEKQLRKEVLVLEVEDVKEF